MMASRARDDGDGKTAAFVMLALAGVFWGLGFPLGKLALRDLAPAHLVLLRFAVAALVSLPFAIGTREARALFRSPPVLAAGLLYGIAFLIQFEGLEHVTVTLAALLVGAMPALVAITARLTGERVSRTSWIGVAGATLGAMLIAGKPGGAGTPYGIAVSLASLLVFLAWLFTLKRAPATASALAIPAVTVLVATAAVLPIALVLHGPPPLALSGAAWAGVIGSGLLATFCATAAWSFGAARVGSAEAGVFINVEPVMGAAIGVGLFGDPLGAFLLLGGLLVVGGSLVVVLGERETPALAETAAATHGLSMD